jgi:hypothetical protein
MIDSSVYVFSAAQPQPKDRGEIKAFVGSLALGGDLSAPAQEQNR